MSEAESFDQVIQRMAEEPSAWAPDDYRLALRVIRRFVMSRFRLSETEADDIASDVMLRFFQLHADGKIDPVKNPASYVRRAAQWTALDHFRLESKVTRREITVAPDDFPDVDPDDNVARALDASSTAQVVRSALARARAAGDTTTYKVVIALLDAADVGGARPSNRQVARNMGISHTAVADAIARFQRYMDEENEDSTPADPATTG